jgi:acetyl esterase/lipase
MIELIFEVAVETFVLMGDSAGGNLVCGLTYWLIESKKQLPKFISLCYPAMYLRHDSYTPSMLYSLDDIFLNYSALRGAISSYLTPDDKPNTDPYISPFVINDLELINMLPKVSVYVGTIDSMYDDAIRFVAKLR